ncbi:Hsp20/alpha crystallin family protein [Lentisphaera profundi]|uniref:Hsp20/alpha crystallin family protein n=1 Tax=Lentisphaera profundi TaxID=1658616 RepID=A0ABY7W200_9BACT|nr:Hsp20/alpha crystallin family protein [Lentisphaera profundi]WDE98308.1 Hsp20/alpha crystallin family protein [Lentisphaera profundi]
MKTKIQPLVDIVDSGQLFNLYFDLPGVKESDLNIDIEDHVLSINAKQLIGDAESSAKCSEKYYECRYELGETINLEQIKAKIEQGVLKIDLPKIAKKSPTKIKIEVA